MELFQRCNSGHVILCNIQQFSVSFDPVFGQFFDTPRFSLIKCSPPHIFAPVTYQTLHNLIIYKTIPHMLKNIQPFFVQARKTVKKEALLKVSPRGGGGRYDAGIFS